MWACVCGFQTLQNGEHPHHLPSKSLEFKIKGTSQPSQVMLLPLRVTVLIVSHNQKVHWIPENRIFYFFKLSFIGVQLLYSIVLFSAVQQSESVIHISSLFQISFPFRSPQNIEQGFLLNGFSLVNLFYTYQCIYVNPNLSSAYPPCPLCIHKLVLFLRVSISVLQQVHLSHFSRFHVQAILYDICFPKKKCSL